LLMAPAVIVIVALLVLPLGYLIRTSFFVGEAGMPAEGGVTIANYAKLFGDTFYVRILGKTLWLSFLVTVVAAIIGYPLAHFMWRVSKRWRGILTIIVLSPLLVSIVVSSYGWLVILGSTGIINNALMWLGIVETPVKIMFTDIAIVVGLSHIVLPFMVLSILAALERIDHAYLEAAKTLGSNELWTAWFVTLPLALPGFLAGTTIVFSLAVSAYVTPAVLGASGPNFITTLIFQQFTSLFNWPLGAAIAAMLLVVALGIVFLYIRLFSRYGGAAVHAQLAEPAK
jgi:putative spermidine/putrescine transport system permease protein